MALEAVIETKRVDLTANFEIIIIHLILKRLAERIGGVPTMGVIPR